LLLIDAHAHAALAGDTIEVISKHYAHSFAERRAAAMDVVGASFAQLGSPLLHGSLSPMNSRTIEKALTDLNSW